MLDEEAIAALRGATFVAAGEDLGEVQEVFTHSWDDRPALVAVNTGDGAPLVPLPDLEEDPGSRIEVSYDRELVTTAPEAAGDTLTEDEFEAVYAHYGISDATMREDSGAFREGTGSGADPRRDHDVVDDASQGHPG